MYRSLIPLEKYFKRNANVSGAFSGSSQYIYVQSSSAMDCSSFQFGLQFSFIFQWPGSIRSHKRSICARYATQRAWIAMKIEMNYPSIETWYNAIFEDNGDAVAGELYENTKVADKI